MAEDSLLLLSLVLFSVPLRGKCWMRLFWLEFCMSFSESIHHACSTIVILSWACVCKGRSFFRQFLSVIDKVFLPPQLTATCPKHGQICLHKPGMARASITNLCSAPSIGSSFWLTKMQTSFKILLWLLPSNVRSIVQHQMYKQVTVIFYAC